MLLTQNSQPITTNTQPLHLTLNFGHPLMGYSLIELMITMIIATAFISIGTTSLTSLLNRNRIILSNNKLIQSLQLARSYAISRQQHVNLCPLAHIKQSTESTTTTKECNNNSSFNNNWSNGWLIFIDYNADKLFNSGDTLLKTVELGSASNINIIFSQRGQLRFSPNGSARSAGFYLCIPKQQIYHRLAILYTGRTRSTADLSTKQKQACEKN